MPMYRFQCDFCGEEVVDVQSIAEHDEWSLNMTTHQNATLSCIGLLHQVYGVNVNLGMREHYSDQLDTVVKSDAHFASELSRQQDEMSHRMGFDVKYDTIDPNDPKAAGVTEAGLESQERAAHAEKSDGHKSVFS